MLSFSHTAVTKVTISKRKTHTNTSTFECSVGNVGRGAGAIAPEEPRLHQLLGLWSRDRSLLHQLCSWSVHTAASSRSRLPSLQSHGPWFSPDLGCSNLQPAADGMAALWTDLHACTQDCSSAAAALTGTLQTPIVHRCCCCCCRPARCRQPAVDILPS